MMKNYRKHVWGGVILLHILFDTIIEYEEEVCILLTLQQHYSTLKEVLLLKTLEFCVQWTKLIQQILLVKANGN
jgi:hypothetical protein